MQLAAAGAGLRGAVVRRAAGLRPRLPGCHGRQRGAVGAGATLPAHQVSCVAPWYICLARTGLLLDASHCWGVGAVVISCRTGCALAADRLLHSCSAPWVCFCCPGWRWWMLRCRCCCRALAAPAVLVASVAQGACLGQQDAWTPFKVLVAAGLLNAGGCGGDRVGGSRGVVARRLQGFEFQKE